MEQLGYSSDEIQSSVDDNEEEEVEVRGFVSTSRAAFGRMCVSSNIGIMLLLWTIVVMVFSGECFYWYISTAPYFQYRDQVREIMYPFSAVAAFLLLCYPALALLGDCFPGKLWPIVIASGLLNGIGLITAFVLVSTVGISYLILIVGFGIMLLACGVFKANIIQYARDAIPSPTTTSLSTFVHWYYWATYLPCLMMTIWFGAYQINKHTTLKIVDFIGVPVIGLMLIVALVLACFIRQCREGCRSFRVAPRHFRHSAIKQVGQITWAAIRGDSHSAPSRLDRAKWSNGGPYADERVDDVKQFWLVFFLLASLFGFSFWDDTRSTVFVHSMIYNDHPVFSKPSSQVMTAIVIFLGIPVYQVLIRPWLGHRLPSATVRIMLGMFLEFLTAVLLVGMNGWLDAETGSNSTLDPQSLCALKTNDTLVHQPSSANVSFPLLYIPQAANGVSQMLVFIGVLELVLSQAPRRMQGLLIGIWYALQSLHPMLGLIELATCAVYYWEYYIFKAAVVFASTVTYVTVATLCFHKRHAHIKYQLLTDTT